MISAGILLWVVLAVAAVPLAPSLIVSRDTLFSVLGWLYAGALPCCLFWLGLYSIGKVRIALWMAVASFGALLAILLVAFLFAAGWSY